MTGRERLEMAIRGGKPDRVPVCPIYDIGYVASCAGLTSRDVVTSSREKYAQIIERGFVQHDVDGYYVHGGTSGDWSKGHTILDVSGEAWLVEENATGTRYRLLPDCSRLTAEGAPIPRNEARGGISRIQSMEDLDRLGSRDPSEADFDAAGTWVPLRQLVGQHVSHHFSFQASTPMVRALQICGGYVEGLTTLASDRALFRKVLSVGSRYDCALARSGARAGGHSMWFTSYYTGADTISPRDYAELVFPYEYDVCRAAKDAGLYVFNWFLGDLMPILDKVMELPIDALVLEQGRKGYEIDPVAIRKRVGAGFCLFGFAFENDFCTFRKEALSREIGRQIAGAGSEGAFVAGTPIMPPNAKPEAVDFYFAEARRLGEYD